jgi:hypothetical protein
MMWGPGFRVQGSAFRILGCGFWNRGFRVQDSGLWFRDWELWLSVQGSCEGFTV